MRDVWRVETASEEEDAVCSAFVESWGPGGWGEEGVVWVVEVFGKGGGFGEGDIGG